VPIATERSTAKNRYSITSSARPGKWRRNGDAERFGGLEIDVKLDFGYLLNRSVGGLVAFENAGGADASQTV
jgi:hypothetical protein